MLSAIEPVRKVSNETYVSGLRSFYIEYKYREMDLKNSYADLKVFRFIEVGGASKPFLFYVNRRNEVVKVDRPLSDIELDVILTKGLIVSDLLLQKTSI